MKIKTWQIITIIFCLILGTLLHFTYEWSGRNILVGIFSAINESTWEHLKLVFYPMFFMAIIGFFIIGKQSRNYWFAQVVGILTAILFITIIFYTYTGIIGTNYALVNIALFVISVILGGYVVYRILILKKQFNIETISIILLISLMLSFITYTFNPPKINYFKDPVSGTYGV